MNQRPLRLWCFGFIVLLLVAASAAADTWPQWRGPNRDGISLETGLTHQWTSTGPQLVWQASGFGSGYSSLAISNQKIFTMGKVGADSQLIAGNVKGGAQLWNVTVSTGAKAPNCTPTVDGDSVYALAFDGELVCADASTGREVWRKSFPRDFGGRMMSGWGYSESPLVDGEKLIVTPGSERAVVAALDKRTGRTLWSASMPRSVGSAGKPGAAYSSVVISNAAGIRQYVQLVGRGVIGVAADTGRLLWTYNRIANGTANIPTPIVKGDYVFCSSGYSGGGSALLRLSRQQDEIQVEEVYYKRSGQLQNHHGGMVLVGDHIYMGHGHNRGLPVCVELETGEISWGPERGPGNGSAAIVYADGHFYFRYENGVMALIEATPDGYNLKGSFQIATNNGRSWPHPVISDGNLYLRDQDDLLCYDVRKD